MKVITIHGPVIEIGSGVVSLDELDLKGNRKLQLDYIKIGEHRLRNVSLTSYVRNFIRTGEMITVSGLQHKNGFAITGIKTADGEIFKVDCYNAIVKFVYLIKMFVGSFLISIIPGAFLASLIDDNDISIHITLVIIFTSILFYYTGIKHVYLMIKAENAISNA